MFWHPNYNHEAKLFEGFMMLEQLCSYLYGVFSTAILPSPYTNLTLVVSSYEKKPLFSSRNLDFGATVAPSFLFGK